MGAMIKVPLSKVFSSSMVIVTVLVLHSTVITLLQFSIDTFGGLLDWFILDLKVLPILSHWWLIS